MHTVQSPGTSISSVKALDTLFLTTTIIFILQTWFSQEAGHLSCCRVKHLPSASCRLYFRVKTLNPSPVPLQMLHSAARQMPFVLAYPYKHDNSSEIPVFEVLMQPIRMQ